VKKSKFTAKEIVAILRETGRGRAVTEVCEEFSISLSTFYKWRTRYGQMSISDVNALMNLEKENAELKKLLKQKDFELEALQRIFQDGQLNCTPNEIIHALINSGVSERRACELLNIPRSSWRYTLQI
jgi:putative transposase